MAQKQCVAPSSKSRRTRSAGRLAGAAVATVGASLAASSAARGAFTTTTTYTNAGGDRLFTSAANYDAGAPASGVLAVFPTIAAPITSGVLVNSAATTGGLQLNDAYTFNNTSGTLTLLTVGAGAAAGDPILSYAAGTGTATIASGSATTGLGLTLGVSGGAIDVATGGTLAVTASIGQSAAGTALVKTGGGTLRLASVGATATGSTNVGSGANTFTGGLTVNAGTVEFANVNNLGGTVAASGTFSFAGALILNGGTLSFNPTATSAAATGRGFGIGSGNGTLNVTGASTLTLNAGVLAASNTSAGSLTKTGPGTLVLGNSTSNISSGITGVTISGGTLQVGGTNYNALGQPATSPLTLDGGTLFLSNVGLTGTTSRAIAVTANDGAIRLATGLTTGASASITGAGRLTVTGAGQLNLSGGSSNFSGGLAITGGATVSTASTGNLGAAPAALTPDFLRLDNGTFAYTFSSTITPVVTLTSNRGLTLGAGGGTVGVTAAGETLAQTATIVSDAGTTAAFTKVGAGSYHANGGATYTGATNVSAGTLRMNGTHANAGSYAVAAGATLGGSGTINLATGNAIMDLGTLSPGNANGSIGTLTVNGGDVSLSDGTTSGGLVVDLNPMAGTVDLLADAGAFNISGATVSFNPANTGTLTAPLVFATYGSLVGGQFANTADLAAQGYAINYAYNGNQIALTSVPSAVPEPAALAVAGVAAAAGLARRRRRA